MTTAYAGMGVESSGLTPFELQALMHCYTKRDVYMPGNDRAQQILAQFVTHGIIEPDDEIPNVFRTTELGRAWVRVILTTPVPTARYVDQHGEVIHGY